MHVLNYVQGNSVCLFPNSLYLFSIINHLEYFGHLKYQHGKLQHGKLSKKNYYTVL